MVPNRATHYKYSLNSSLDVVQQEQFFLTAKSRKQTSGRNGIYSLLLLTYKRRKVDNALNRKWVYQNGLCIWYRDCIKLQKSGEDKQYLSWFSSKLSNESFVFIQCSEALFPEFRTGCLWTNYYSSNNLKIGKII